MRATIRVRVAAPIFATLCRQGAWLQRNHDNRIDAATIVPSRN